MTARADPRRSCPRVRDLVGGMFGLGLAFMLLSACGDSDPRLTVRDRDGREADTKEIEVYRGPDHCGWEGVTFLRLGSPVGQNMGHVDRMYIRDPDGVLADQTVRKFNRRVTLPNDARFTGYASDPGQLWFARDDQDTVAYFVSDDGGRHVEAWPRTKAILGCD